MQGLARQEEFGFQFRGPIGCDEIEITILVGAVDFVADDGMSDLGKVNSDLVGPAGSGFRGHKSKRVSIPQQATQNAKIGEGRVPIRMHGLFKPYFRWANRSLAEQWLVDSEGVALGASEYNGDVSLSDTMLGNQETEGSSGFG